MTRIKPFNSHKKYHFQFNSWDKWATVQVVFLMVFIKALFHKYESNGTTLAVKAQDLRVLNIRFLYPENPKWDRNPHSSRETKIVRSLLSFRRGEVGITKPRNSETPKPSSRTPCMTPPYIEHQPRMAGFEIKYRFRPIKIN